MLAIFIIINICKSNHYAAHLKLTQTHFPILYLLIIIMKKSFFPINTPFLGLGLCRLKKWVWTEGEWDEKRSMQRGRFSSDKNIIRKTLFSLYLCTFPSEKKVQEKKKKNSPNHNANKYLWYRLKFLLTVYQGQKKLGLPRVIYEHREISV